MAGERDSLPAGASKAALRRRLPSMLEESRRDAATAVAALRAYCIAGIQPPDELLTAKNIRRLATEEILHTLARLGERKSSADYSAVLEVLRDKVGERQWSAKSFNALNRQVANRILKLAGAAKLKSAPKTSSLSPVPRPDFTSETGRSAVELAESLIRVGKTLWTGKRGVENAYRTASLWLKVIEAIVRENSELAALASVLRFWRRLDTILPRAAHARVIGDEEANSYVERLRSHLLRRIEPALLNGRLDELQRLLTFAEWDPAMREPIRSALTECAKRRLLELPPGVSEWLDALFPELREPTKRLPTAAEESQSAAVESVATCLLSVWDSTADPSRAESALKTLEGVARDLFKLRLLGRVGEVVEFDPRHHETVESATDLESAKIVRPGVIWSDGLRSRTVVRALVEREA